MIVSHEDGADVTIPLPSGELLPTFYRAPEDTAPGAAVLIVSDIYGRIPFYRSLVAQLADAGLAAALPDYFFRQGPLAELTREHAFARHARLDEAGSLADLDAALDWLRERTGAGPGRRLGVLGFCLGGTLALDLAARRRDLAAVSYYGFPLGMRHPRPAPRPIDCVPELGGPALAFWGAEDDLVRDSEITDLARAAESAGVDYQHVVYPGAGHGFLRSTAESGPAGVAARDSWRRTLEFFAEHLADQADA